jgi:diphthamide biosynthesis protein 2
MYVIVSCPETSLIDTKEFSIPIATPHELFMALDEENFPWESKIITDFK